MREKYPPLSIWSPDGAIGSRVKGFDLPRKSCSTRGFGCGECGNQCEVIELLVNHQGVACLGDPCERYRQTMNGIAHGA